MPVLDFAELERLAAGSPLKAVFALQGLAPWWLTDTAVRAAIGTGHPAVAEYLSTDTPPMPSNTPGSCWLVCAVTGSLPLFRPAVVLPLQWRKGMPQSVQLPPMLRALADDVIADVRKMDDMHTAGDGWGLYPAFGDGLALADDLFSTLDSGWAALAGGLIAAVIGLTPDIHVWASVRWSDGRADTVDGLPAKMETAAAFGAKVFFVHPLQAIETAVRAPTGLRVAAIGPQVATGVTESLRYYVAELTREPPKPVAGATDEEDQFVECRKYFVKLIGFTTRAKDYYDSHLLDAIVRRYRRRFEAQASGLRVQRFVTIVSFSPELAEIVVKAIQPERVLLLHTKDKKQVDLALEYKARLAVVKLDTGGTVDCVLGPFDIANAPVEIGGHITVFTAGVPQSHVVLDLKPGTKKMTYSVIAAARPGNHLLNMEPEFLDDRRNTPGTEIPELLPAIGCHPTPPSA